MLMVGHGFGGVRCCGGGGLDVAKSGGDGLVYGVDGRVVWRG